MLYSFLNLIYGDSKYKIRICKKTAKYLTKKKVWNSIMIRRYGDHAVKRESETDAVRVYVFQF